MSLKECLDSKKFAVIAEIQPPKGTDLTEALEHIEQLRGRADSFNIPDLQNAIMRLSSLSTCALLKSKGVDVIFNLSCSSRNRLALQSELLGASALGIRNILLLPGEHPSIGDHFEAQPVFDLDLMGLLAATKRLQEGYDLEGNELKGKPSFCVGTLVNTSAKDHLLDIELAEMEKKIRTGVDFFMTHSIYDVTAFESFIRRVSHWGIPIIATVTLLKSVGMARYINKHVEGAPIPDGIIDRLMKASDKQKASIEIAGDLIRQMRPLCQGVQIVPLGWESLVPALLDSLGRQS